MKLFSSMNPVLVQKHNQSLLVFIITEIYVGNVNIYTESF